MKLSELLKQIPIVSASVDLDTEITGVSYDSRHTEPGDLFVAVVGFATDGHKYINAALEKGAAAILCQTPPEGEIPYVRVANSRYALAIASRNWFGDPAGEMTMIGVTGTNGKTTSTLLLKHVLEHTLGAKVGLIGTNANMIGDREIPTERTTPESYELQKLFREMYDAGCTHVVMEVSSHALDQDRVAGVRFAAGVFTNLTQDHLDYHKTMENYAAAKARLFSISDAAVINLDDPWARYFIKEAQCPVTTYSVDDNAADLVAKDVRLLPDRVRFRAVAEGEIERVELGIPGRFSVYNALDVLACCGVLGVSLEAAAAALVTARGVKGRVETVPTDGDYTILIDYAHTPDALENVLKTLRDVAPDRQLICLFGCGGDRDKTKRPEMGAVAGRLADRIFITSDNSRSERTEDIMEDIRRGLDPSATAKAVSIADRREAIRTAILLAPRGATILLAGKGHETYQILGTVKHHFDEREIVLETFKTIESC